MKNSILLITLAAMLLTGCAAGGSRPGQADTPAVSQESIEIPFVAKYIRTGGYVSGKEYPVTTVIRSVPELMDYFAASKDVYDLGDTDGIRSEGETFIDAAGKYNEDYFKDNALILILLEEPSGSIRHNVSSVTGGGGGINITIERLVPEEQTCDMAEWHIFVELAKDKAQDNISVTFVNINIQQLK